MSNFQDRCSEFFDSADTDGTGCLTKMELCKVCVASGCNKTVAEIADWFDDLDTNDDDKVSKTEFLTALGKIPPTEVKEADLRCAFKKFDRDGSGCITLDELKQAVVDAGGDPAEAELDMDTNDDGKVNFEEFLKAWRSTQ